MLRLLRRLRRSVMTDDAPSKLRTYAAYAAGEIVLVVIGILIALQIGEWAERRSDEEALRAILVDVQEDLASDVAAADRLLPFAARRRAQADSILAGAFDRDDYLGTGWRERGPGPVGDDARFDLFWVGMQYLPYTPSRTAFDRLTDFGGVIPASYRPLMDALGHHYVEEWAMLESRTEQFVTQVEDRHRHFSHTFPWYWRLRSQEWDEEMVEWHLNSDQRRGYLTRWKADDPLRSQGYVDSYRVSAISAYLAIADRLGTPVRSEAIPDDLVLEDPARVGPWTGEWQMRDASDGDETWIMRLELRGGVAYFAGDPLGPPVVLRPVNDTTFADLYFQSDQEFVLTSDPAGERIIRVVDGGGEAGTTWVRPER